MNYIDLFHGIGGFAVGAYWAGMKFENHYCSDIEPYDFELYKKRFPDSIQLGDIREIDCEKLMADTDSKYDKRRTESQQSDSKSGEAWNKSGGCCNDWIITGGFPCQDISVAGKGTGIRGHRSGLWFEMWRIIRDLRPRFAIMENVGALTFRGLTDVLGSLAEIGYDAEWQDIRAEDMGAPHRRERIWIIAYPGSKRLERGKCESSRKTAITSTERSCEEMAYPNGERESQSERNERQEREWIINSSEEISDTTSSGRRSKRTAGETISGSEKKQRLAGCNQSSGRNWSVEPAVGRLAHGISSTLDITIIKEYILKHERKRKTEMEKKTSESNTAYKLRIMRFYCELAETSRQLGNTGNCKSTLSKLSYGLRLQERDMGKREKIKTEMRNMWNNVSSERQPCTQDLRCNLPFCVRTAECYIEMGLRQNRLKGLGNAIVPQIAELLFRQIKEQI